MSGSSVRSEVWKKVPGWRLEVSDLGRVRNLAGRVLELERQKGTYRFRYTGSDEDPAAKRMFTVASLVLHVFDGCPLRTCAIHIDGDRFNCCRDNLRPGRVLPDRGDPQYLVPVVWEAAEKARRILKTARVPAAQIDRVLSGSRPGGWSEVDRCVAILDDAGMSGAQIAAAMGFLPRVITSRKIALGRTKRNEPGAPLHGEGWRHVPGFRAHVSTLGRVRGPSGLLKGTRSRSGRWRVKLLLKEGDGTSRSVSIGSLVLHVFRGADLSVYAEHLNGDLNDHRLANLVEGEHEILRAVRRKDTPWTKEQDRALKTVTSWDEGARVTGHTLVYVKKRMRKLGIDLDAGGHSRRGKQLALPCRDLAALQEAVAVLERMGVADRVINLGLRILPHPKGQRHTTIAAAEQCIMALADAGWNDGQIADGMGVARATIGQAFRRLGMRAPWPKGSSTRAGPIDPRQGEEWRDVPGLPYVVSNMGRVANARGDLLAQVLNQTNRYHVCLADRSRSGRRYTTLVSRLVLAAFKPELNARQAAYLNGDVAEITPENLVPRRTLDQAAGPVPRPGLPAPTKGNLATTTLAPARGSVPFYDPLWTEARKLCPPYLADHVRDDLISDTVMLYLDGRAHSIPDAFKLAKRQYNQTMGVGRETSLDAERGDGGFTLGHLLASDGEMMNRSQAKSGRA